MMDTLRSLAAPASEHGYTHPRWQRVRGRLDRGLLGHRALESPGVRNRLVSVAGLVGGVVSNQAGDEVGRIVDLIAAIGPATETASEFGAYPEVRGLIVRVGRRRTWVPSAQVAEVSGRGARLLSSTLDLQEFVRRPHEVELATSVLDHQLVDVDDRRVIRAADLLLARLAGDLRIVGVDVSMRTLLRRLGPTRWRARPTPGKVIDWAAIEPLGSSAPVGGVRLRKPASALEAMRPAELADLLEELGRRERQLLLARLEPSTAADAVEEMDAGDVQSLLRDASPEQVAELVSEMEPDEAVDALRHMSAADRDELLGSVSAEVGSRLADLLGYEEGTAGGLMTSTLVACLETETVAEVTEKLRTLASHAIDLSAIVVVDADGRLIDDVTVIELLLADRSARLADLIGPPWPVTVAPDAPVQRVAIQLIENRSASLVVIDEEGRPLGRILADDIVDALVGERGRLQLFRQAPA